MREEMRRKKYIEAGFVEHASRAIPEMRDGVSETMVDGAEGSPDC